MKVDVLIPNYNGSALFKKNLPSVLRALKKYKESKIIIVDDASDISDKDSLKQIIKNENSEKIVFIENERNLGFSSTVNKGVRVSSADYIVLLNSDVSPSENFLSKPIEELERNKDLFGIGFLDKSIEGEKTIERGRGVAWWSRGFLKHKKGDPSKTDTFWISGGSSIIKKDIFKKLGGFDDLFNPFYWEDIDLSYRAQKSGYKLRFMPKSIVTHVHSEGAIKTHFSQSEINTIAFRNELFFIWKNITDVKMILEHILFLKIHLIKSLFKMDASVLVGFAKAFAKLPVIISKRVNQKKLYVLTDREIIK